MSRSIFRAAILAGAISAAGGALAQSGSADDVVVARVDGTEIYSSDVALLHSTLPQQYRRMPVDLLFDQLVESLVDRVVVANLARGAGLLEDTKIKRRIALSIEGILHETYIVRGIDAAVTDERLRIACSETIAAQGGETEVHARHILLENEKDALAVIAELQAGADFVDLASKRSRGPSASSGGDLGYFAHGKMVPEFADAAFAIGDGEITTTPVKTQFGWHVIRVEGRRQGAPPSFEDSVDALREEEARRVMTEIVANARQGARVTLFNPDGSDREQAKE